MDLFQPKKHKKQKNPKRYNKVQVKFNVVKPCRLHYVANSAMGGVWFDFLT